MTSRELAALRAEATQLTTAAREWPQTAWDLPSPCPPWTNRDLFAHVIMTVERVPALLADPTPPSVATTDPTQYYRDGQALAPAASDERVTSAQRLARSFATSAGLVDRFAHAWPTVADQCAAEPAGRTVRTRHGDAMLLGDYLRTRVVEIVLHGIDLAVGVGRAPWTSSEGGAAVASLLLARSPEGSLDALGWDRAALLTKATGRAPITSEERRSLHQHGITLFVLG